MTVDWQTDWQIARSAKQDLRGGPVFRGYMERTTVFETATLTLARYLEGSGRCRGVDFTGAVSV